MISREEAGEFADTLYANDGYEDRVERLFAFAVDVFDAYVTELEQMASDEAAPYLGATPLDGALNGLRENIDLRREGR